MIIQINKEKAFLAVLKMKRKFGKSILTLALFATTLGLVGSCGTTTPPDDGNTPPTDQEEKSYVKSIKITSNPTKTKYLEGEIFKPDGLKFDATWVIRGEERVVKQTKTHCTWTHENTPLTKDINKITFTIKQTDYTFDIPITVESIDIQKIVVDRSTIKDNYLENDTIDLTSLVVKTENSKGEQKEISAGSYKIFDNDKEIELSKTYKLTAGTHNFKITFSEKETTFSLRAWGMNEFTPVKLEVRNYNFGTSLFAGQTINLSKIEVKEVFETAKKEFSYTKVIDDYILKDNDKEIPVEERLNYKLTKGKHEFSILKDELVFKFSLETSNYDVLLIERKGEESGQVAKGTTFYGNYSVSLTNSSNPEEKMLVNKGDYTISATLDGKEIADVTEENVFDNIGKVKVTVTYKSLVQTIEVDVVGAMIINTTNAVFTKNLPLDESGNIRRDDHGNLINADGTEFKTTVPNAGEEYVVGKNFLEVPPNPNVSQNDGYGEVGLYDDPAHIGNIKAGQKLVFHIWADEEMEVDVAIYAASMNFADMNNWDGTYPTATSAQYYQPTVTEDVVFNSGIQTTYGKDETPLEVSDTVIVPGYTSQITEPNGQKQDTEGRYYDPRIWTQWSPVVIGKLNLSKGDNILTFRVNINQLNLGMLEIRF